MCDSVRLLYLLTYATKVETLGASPSRAVDEIGSRIENATGCTLLLFVFVKTILSMCSCPFGSPTTVSVAHMPGTRRSRPPALTPSLPRSASRQVHLTAGPPHGRSTSRQVRLVAGPPHGRYTSRQVHLTAGPPHGRSRSSPAFQAFGFCRRRRLPAAGAGAALAPLALSWLGLRLGLGLGLGIGLRGGLGFGLGLGIGLGIGLGLGLGPWRRLRSPWVPRADSHTQRPSSSARLGFGFGFGFGFGLGLGVGLGSNPKPNPAKPEPSPSARAKPPPPGWWWRLGRLPWHTSRHSRSAWA